MKKRTAFQIAVLLFAVSCVLGCIAAIPVAIMYYEKNKNYIAEAEMPAPAEKIYRTALDMAEERSDIKIVKKEDDKLYVEVTDGKQIASLKAEAVTQDRSNVFVMADVPKTETQAAKELEKELALRIVNRICSKLEVKCTIKGNK